MFAHRPARPLPAVDPIGPVVAAVFAPAVFAAAWLDGALGRAA